jgi:ribonuclease D
MNNLQYIDNPESLEEFCTSIMSVPWLAIDTEFQREKTYYSKLALIQIATPDLVAIIDPLSCDIELLLDVLYDENIIKIFHAARQDQEIFYNLRGKSLSPVFDTQVAAPLLGHPEQAGYARLVDDILGVQLAKAHSRTDWIRRPLSDDQIRYAADDVIYLVQIYLSLIEKLEQKQRLSWLIPQFNDLCNPDLYAAPPELAWKRIRAAKRLKGGTLSVVQSLAEWREDYAQKRNIPRGWLIKDDLLIEIAKLKPLDIAALSEIRGINDKLTNKFGAIICECVQSALAKKPSPNEKQNKSKKSGEREEAIADILMAHVRLSAEKSGMNPTSITNRKELLRLIQGERELDILSDWRAELVGNALLETLQGKHSFIIHNKQLQISHIN